MWTNESARVEELRRWLTVVVTAQPTHSFYWWCAHSLPSAYVDICRVEIWHSLLDFDLNIFHNLSITFYVDLRWNDIQMDVCFFMYTYVYGWNSCKSEPIPVYPPSMVKSQILISLVLKSRVFLHPFPMFTVNIIQSEFYLLSLQYSSLCSSSRSRFNLGATWHFQAVKNENRTRIHTNPGLVKGKWSCEKLYATEKAI